MSIRFFTFAAGYNIMIGIGTLANAGAIIVGGLLGVIIHSKLPKKVVDIVFQGLGLVTFVLGISLALKSGNIVLMVISIVTGSIIGEWVDLDRYVNMFSHYLEKRIGSGSSKKRSQDGEEDKSRFSEGFLTASILFCVGSMAILGAFEEGMGETPNILYTKSVMDGISSVAFASSFGIGVIFSSIPLLIYQGGLTLFATFIMKFMTDQMMADLSASGGVLLLGLAINMLKIKSIKVINMLPSLLIIVILSYFFG